MAASNQAYYFLCRLRAKAATNAATVPYIVASSWLLAHLCSLHLTFILIYSHIPQALRFYYSSLPLIMIQNLLIVNLIAT